MSEPTTWVTAALASIALLSACSGDADGARFPSTATTSSTPTTPPASPDGWTPLPAPEGETALVPGRYGMEVNGRPDTPRAVVTLPEGFEDFDGWTVWDSQHEGVGLGYWTVSEVSARPCGDGAGNKPLEAGSTVQDLVDALGEQAQTRMTKPVAVTLGGHQGVRLDLQMPRDVKVSECLGEQYLLWESDPEGARHIEEPGRTDRVSIVDVDGEVVVLQITFGPDVPQRDLRRVDGVLQSVEFVDWPR